MRKQLRNQMEYISAHSANITLVEGREALRFAGYFWNEIPALLQCVERGGDELALFIRTLATVPYDPVVPSDMVVPAPWDDLMYQAAAMLGRVKAVYSGKRHGSDRLDIYHDAKLHKRKFKQYVKDFINDFSLTVNERLLGIELVVSTLKDIFLSLHGVAELMKGPIRIHAVALNDLWTRSFYRWKTERDVVTMSDGSDSHPAFVYREAF